MERYNNGWNVWVHPLWNALLSNPAYYYYYTAKAALLNQVQRIFDNGWKALKASGQGWASYTTSVMVRKGGGSRGPKRPPPVSAPVPVQSSPSLPFGALGAIGNGINSALKRYGIDECPQCKATFNGSNCRPVQDSCGHFKCRLCFISNEDGCPQCLISSNGVQENGSSRRPVTIAANENQHSRSNGTCPTTQSLCVDQSQNMQHGSPAHQANLIHQPLAPETSKIYSSSSVELNTAPEFDPPGTDTIYANNALLKSECNGIAEFSIHENSLLNVMSYTSIINQETDFSKSLMSFRTDHPNNDVGGIDAARRNSLSNESSNGLNPPSAFSAPGTSSSSNETSVTSNPQDTQEWNSKSPKKRKIVEEPDISNSPRKVVRFADSKASPECLTDESSPSSNANKSERSTPSPGKSGNAKSAPKFFTQGNSNRESLKNAAMANVKLNKTTSSERKSRSSRAEKNSVDLSSKADASSKSSKSYTHDKYTRQNAHLSDKPEEKLQRISSLAVPEEDQQSKSQGRARVLNPPSPPEVTLFKPKITYGRSSKKSKESPSPLRSSTSYQPPISTEVQLTFPDASDSNDQPGHSGNSKPRLVAATSVNGKVPSKTSTNSTPSLGYQKASTSHGLDPLATRPSSDTQGTKDGNASDRTKSTNMHESKFLQDIKSDGEGDGEPKDKKKKKRNPVVIHDHITVIAGDPTMFQCNVCNKKFKTKAHIKYHEFCQNGTKPFKCEECGQGFIAKSHYEYHLRTHTGERPYVCPKCGKGFNQRGKVTRHMRSHTGEKPFICVECGRGFANAQALRSHHLIHTGERPFACKYCQKRFTGMTNLKKHIITHTGERPYVCTHCGKSFGLKWTLDLHLRTHSSERPYACDQCMRAFSNSKDLRRHLVIHSGERPFKCWICGTAFRRKDNLDRHIKNTHNQPKEVAKQLANEAAAEYLAQSKQAPVPISKVNSAVISNVIKSAQFPQPGKTSEKNKTGSSTSNNRDVTSRVIITAELSPHGESTMADAYILPDGDDSETSINSVDTSKIEVEDPSQNQNTFQTIDVAQFQRMYLIENRVEQQGDMEDPESPCPTPLHTEGIIPAVEDVKENEVCRKMDLHEISCDQSDDFAKDDVSYEEALRISTVVEENREEQQVDMKGVLEVPESLCSRSLNNEGPPPAVEDVQDNENRVERQGDMKGVLEDPESLCSRSLNNVDADVEDSVEVPFSVSVPDPAVDTISTLVEDSKPTPVEESVLEPVVDTVESHPKQSSGEPLSKINELEDLSPSSQVVPRSSLEQADTIEDATVGGNVTLMPAVGAISTTVEGSIHAGDDNSIQVPVEDSVPDPGVDTISTTDKDSKSTVVEDSVPDPGVDTILTTDKDSKSTVVEDSVPDTGVDTISTSDKDSKSTVVKDSVPDPGVDTISTSDKDSKSTVVEDSVPDPGVDTISTSDKDSKSTPVDKSILRPVVDTVESHQRQTSDEPSSKISELEDQPPSTEVIPHSSLDQVCSIEDATVGPTVTLMPAVGGISTTVEGLIHVGDDSIQVPVKDSVPDPAVDKISILLDISKTENEDPSQNQNTFQTIDVAQLQQNNLIENRVEKQGDMEDPESPCPTPLHSEGIIPAVEDVKENEVGRNIDSIEISCDQSDDFAKDGISYEEALKISTAVEENREEQQSDMKGVLEDPESLWSRSLNNEGLPPAVEDVQDNENREEWQGDMKGVLEDPESLCSKSQNNKGPAPVVEEVQENENCRRMELHEISCDQNEDFAKNDISYEEALKISIVVEESNDSEDLLTIPMVHASKELTEDDSSNIYEVEDQLEEGEIVDNCSLVSISSEEEDYPTVLTHEASQQTDPEFLPSDETNCKILFGKPISILQGLENNQKEPFHRTCEKSNMSNIFDFSSDGTNVEDSASSPAVDTILISEEDSKCTPLEETVLLPVVDTVESHLRQTSDEPLSKISEFEDLPPSTEVIPHSSLDEVCTIEDVTVGCTVTLKPAVGLMSTSVENSISYSVEDSVPDPAASKISASVKDSKPSPVEESVLKPVVDTAESHPEQFSGEPPSKLRLEDLPPSTEVVPRSSLEQADTIEDATVGGNVTLMPAVGAISTTVEGSIHAGDDNSIQVPVEDSVPDPGVDTISTTDKDSKSTVVEDSVPDPGVDTILTTDKDSKSTVVEDSVPDPGVDTISTSDKDSKSTVVEDSVPDPGVDTISTSDKDSKSTVVEDSVPDPGVDTILTTDKDSKSTVVEDSLPAPAVDTISTLVENSKPTPVEESVLEPVVDTVESHLKQTSDEPPLKIRKLEVLPPSTEVVPLGSLEPACSSKDAIVGTVTLLPAVDAISTSVLDSKPTHVEESGLQPGVDTVESHLNQSSDAPSSKISELVDPPASTEAIPRNYLEPAYTVEDATVGRPMTLMPAVGEISSAMEVAMHADEDSIHVPVENTVSSPAVYNISTSVKDSKPTPVEESVLEPVVDTVESHLKQTSDEPPLKIRKSEDLPPPSSLISHHSLEPTYSIDDAIVGRNVTQIPANVERLTYSTSDNLRFYTSNTNSSYETCLPSQISLMHHDGTQMLENQSWESNGFHNGGLVYATATAEAVHNDDGCGPPMKVKLIHAEAFVRDPNNMRYLYASTTPAQEVSIHSPVVQLDAPVAMNLSTSYDTGEVTIDDLQYVYNRHNDSAPTSVPSHNAMSFAMPVYRYSTGNQWHVGADLNPSGTLAQPESPTTEALRLCQRYVRNKETRNSGPYSSSYSSCAYETESDHLGNSRQYNQHTEFTEYASPEHQVRNPAHVSNPRKRQAPSTATSYETWNSYNDAARQPNYARVNEDSYQQPTDYSRDAPTPYPTNYSAQPHTSSSGSTTHDYSEWTFRGYPVKIPSNYNAEEPDRWKRIAALAPAIMEVERGIQNGTAKKIEEANTSNNMALDSFGVPVSHSHSYNVDDCTWKRRSVHSGDIMEVPRVRCLGAANQSQRDDRGRTGGLSTQHLTDAAISDNTRQQGNSEARLDSQTYHSSTAEHRQELSQSCEMDYNSHRKMANETSQAIAAASAIAKVGEEARKRREMEVMKRRAAAEGNNSYGSSSSSTLKPRDKYMSHDYSKH